MNIEWSAENLSLALARGRKIRVVDVREESERLSGFLGKSLHIPLGQLTQNLSRIFSSPDEDVLFYCAAGSRSLRAAKQAREAGHSNAYSLEGGIQAWIQEGRAIELPESALSKEQSERFRRHLMLPEVGIKGQAQLLRSKVAIVGAGGLGSPCALYLAAAGVGTLGLIDDDRVELSNLQRQIIHSTETLGQPKVESAKKSLLALHPGVEVKTYFARLSSSNVMDILREYDVIIDGSDNFATRYLVNQASVRLEKPLIYGAVFRFQGQFMTFLPDGPCYQCLYREPPADELAPSCSEAGVLGVVPGIIGTLQAMEALKLLLSIGVPAATLQSYDAWEGRWQEFKVRKNPDCPTCSGKEPQEWPESKSPALCRS